MRRQDSQKKSRHNILDHARMMIHQFCRILIYTAVIAGGVWLSIDAVSYFGTSHDFKIREVSITGANWTTPEEIQLQSELKIGTNIWFVPCTRVAQRIARHPWVRFCRVSKIPPDRISIVIQERRPVCTVLDRRHGVLYGLDPSGIVLPALFSPHPDPSQSVDTQRLEAVRGLPFLTGPAIVFVPGHPIEDSRYMEALHLLVHLETLSPAFLSQIDSVELSEEGRMELFPAHRVERIRIPSQVPDYLPGQIIQVWSLLEKENIDAEYIDARFPKAGVALRPKELQPSRWYELCSRNSDAA
ncbi:MAG TPA: FtsQ-type POTRA domain-containing protein [bacterium]|mgnify:FL=1|nr:FtsQ-type POTRA domain-containing protein [bacterium]HQO33395.1 FtsQ-type POTRA domain-containing protein [bacterium]HQP98638.1 FtsQ-type POTRA domain-containing protein [bacterium]